MEKKRKVGITLCSVSLGIEVLLIPGIAGALHDTSYLHYSLAALIPLLLAGLCVAMIVMQCKMFCPKTQFMMSVAALIVAVLQFIVPTILFFVIITGDNGDSFWSTAFLLIAIMVPVAILCIVVIVLLSVNVKLAKDMKQGGGAQQVVFVTAEDGTQQAMAVQEMN